MMYSEFFERTGIEIPAWEYRVIEEAYYEADCDKNEFCSQWLKDYESGAWKKELKLRSLINDQNQAMKEMADAQKKLEAELDEAIRKYWEEVSKTAALTEQMEKLHEGVISIMYLKDGTKIENNSVKVRYTDNDGKPFITIEEKNGWCQSFRMSEIERMYMN